MTGTMFVISLMVVLVTAALPPEPPDPMPSPTCASVKCAKPRVCRMVLQSRFGIQPYCLLPSDILDDKDPSKVCGPSGHPLLIPHETESSGDRKDKVRVVYKIFRCKDTCPALDLLFVNGVCCFGVDICLLPKDPGPCKASFPRYYFDSKKNKCSQFIYGGCRGNKNNFKSLEECEDACPGDICQLPKVVGPCKAAFPRFYYDAKKDMCLPFTFGGCQGNKNNFKTLKECQDACGKLPPTPICPLLLGKEVCRRTCKEDRHCKKGQLCCRTECGGTVCTPAILPPTCATVLCEEGTRCVEDEKGAFCEPIPLPGICPPPVGFGICAFTCGVSVGGSACPKGELCCETSCGGTVCTPPILPPSCATILCAAGTRCVQTEKGARCVPIDICQQPKEIGPCRAAIPRYYYDSTQKKCLPFTFGGCGGNNNNFETLKECESVCGKPPMGICPPPFPPPGKKKCGAACKDDSGCRKEGEKCCETGCGYDACTPTIQPPTCASTLCPVGTACKETSMGAKCVKVKPGQCPPILLRKDDPCPAVPVRRCEEDADCKGNLKCCDAGCDGTACLTLIPTSCRTLQCKEGFTCQDTPKGAECVPDTTPGICPPPEEFGICAFTCDGDSSCKEGEKCCNITSCGGTVCTRPVPPPTCATLLCKRGTRCVELDEGARCVPEDICEQPKVVGPCRAAFPRFYYDSKQKMCLPFIFGGCQGNQNNFKTLEECQKTCDICQQPKDVGPCRAAIPRFYYDSEQKKCLRFIFGGCQGNQNNFQTFEECQKTCGVDICQQPKDVGPCRAAIPRFYYDSEQKKCLLFIFGGCQGNQNNFQTFEECQKTCGIENPGKCPKLIRPKQLCGPRCKSDLDCPRDEKCCDVGCKGGDICVTPDPEPPIVTCQTAKCSPGFTCIETPKGPNCVPINDKPGQCPKLEGPELCGPECKSDKDCLQDLKCCDRGCKEGKTCIKPDLPTESCDSVDCPPGTICLETEDGTGCFPSRPGVCPILKCIIPFDEKEKKSEGKCRDECSEDYDCPKDHKCCGQCFSNCNICKPADFPDQCGTVKCKKGEKCILQTVVCITTPCLPIPVCVPQGEKEGKCPTPGPDSVKQCKDQCKGQDQKCKGQDKCCPTSCAGGTSCTPPLPANSCQGSTCPKEQTCREVLAREQVVAQCLVKPPKSPKGAECPVGFPLLFSNGLDIVVIFCGRGPQRNNCPPGYHCKTSPVDAFAVCCRNEGPVCYPECGVGEACVTAKTVCKKLPCPPVPRCVDSCLLPKDPGPCEAAIDSFYYDSSKQQCLPFVYGGCEGNGNNFETVMDCQAACSKHVCKLPKKTGPCLGYFPRYYYDSAERKCLKFIYGGCQGNANNFLSAKDCAEACNEEKPGECPKARKLCSIGSPCEEDRDCPGFQKCCGTGCRGTVCVDPVITSCTDERCPPGTVCVDTEFGPECERINLGQCPLFKCPVPFPKLCEDECRGDGDCKGGAKCCFSCDGCDKCLPPFIPNFCADVKCKAELECTLQGVVCITNPCFPVPVCIPKGEKDGKCPTPGPDSVQLCKDQCKGQDQQCKGRDKCCPTSCAGGTSCIPPIPPRTCQDVKCTKGKKCREVYDLEEVSPQCLEDPPESPRDECEFGQPLLLYTGGEITIPSCGSGLDSIVCPLGYSCRLESKVKALLCCPDRVPSCYPPCRPDEECVTEDEKCPKKPCPPVPRCVKKDRCLEPKEPGPCLAFFERYYYDAEEMKCKSFVFGGCKGNDNNFETLLDCRVACEKVKPGQCPVDKGPGPCVSLCGTDRDCPGDTKCCSNGCGTVCKNPQLTCFDKMCPPGKDCIETEAEPQCVPIKPGRCLPTPCAKPLIEVPCNDECEQDTDCKGDLKCCRGCDGCKQCASPFLGSGCKEVKCLKGEKCELQTVFCVTTPCYPVPVCVSEGEKEGKCPTPGPDSVKQCKDQCKGKDQKCKRKNKCCPTSCGGTACTPPVPRPPPTTCQAVKCEDGKICREVYNLKEVSPQCLEKPPEASPDAKCPVGLPLLLFADKEISIMFCGRGPKRLDCPPGYQCNVSPTDAFAICCRDQVPDCYPACKEGERCDKTVINCVKAPCPPFPRCVKEDKCLLPKDVGPCEALIPKYYYDTVQKDCLPFDYGGCEGNDNRFDSVHECQEACSEHICILPSETGLCKARIPSVYFNSKTGKCEPFIYGGCGGNANRFPNKKKCKEVCKKKKSKKSKSKKGD